MAKTLAVETTRTGLEEIKSQPERLMEFLRSVRSEMHKVVTPTRAEVQTNTVIVVATVFVFAAYFWVVDTVVGTLIERTINHLTHH